MREATSLESLQNLTNSEGVLSEAKDKQKRARLAAAGAYIGGVALGIGAGVLAGSALDTDTVLKFLAASTAAVATGSPFIVLGTEWLERAAAEVEAARPINEF